MMLRPFAVIGLSTITATATMASVQDGRDTATPGPSAAARIAAMGSFDLPEVDFDFRPANNRPEVVQPARVFKKTPSAELGLPSIDNGRGFAGTGRVLIKFRNDARVRANLFPSNTLISAGGLDISVVTEILDDHDATIQQLINKSPSQLAKINRKVRKHSNRIAPDLASFTVVSFPDGISGRDLLDLGRRLNDLHIVEWLSFETPVYPASPMGDAPIIAPDRNPATATPNFVANDGTDGGARFGEWLTTPIQADVPTPIPPTDVANYPPYTYQTNGIQQYQLGGSTNTFADVVNDNPETWFGSAGFDFTLGYDLPGMVRLAGQAWRRYGSKPSDRDVFDVGSGPGSGFTGTLPNPTKVWFFGAEFEIVDIAEYNQIGGVTSGDVTYGEGFIPDPTNPNGPWVENPDCPGCIPGYPVIPRLESGDIPIKNANNPFPEFATDLYHLEIYENIILCPTGRRVEIGVVDIAAFERHEEFMFDRYGRTIPVDERSVVFEEGQTMVLLEGPQGERLRNNASHGTAVIGSLVAGNNNFGFTGMAWGSRVRFYPSLSVEEGARLSTAIISAIGDLEAGSILCLPLQTSQSGNEENDPDNVPEIGVYAGPNAAEPAAEDYPPPAPSNGQFLSSNGLYASLITLARDAGIVVIEAAGNAGDPCEPSLAGGGLDEAEILPSIIVTASTPTSYLPGPSPFWGAPFFTNESEDPPPTESLGWPSCGLQGFATPLTPPATRWAASNYFAEESEVNILGSTVSGWGMGMPTLGFGDLYRSPEAPAGIDLNELDPLEIDWLKSYTGPRAGGLLVPLPPLYNPSNSPEVTQAYVFGNEGNIPLPPAPPLPGPWPHQGIQFQGTSAAATQISGFTAWVLGFGQMFYDTPLSKDQILSAMGAIGGVDEMVNSCEAEENDDGLKVGHPQGGPGVGVNNVAINSVVALVPPVPNGPRTAIGVLTQIGQGFSGDLTIYWGDRVRGNKFSLANELDGNALGIRSEPAEMGQINEGITYLVNGFTTDFGIIFETATDADDILTMGVEVTRRVTVLPNVFEIAYARDYTTDRYVPLGVSIPNNSYDEPDGVGAYPFGQDGAPAIANFISDDKKVDIRFYTLSFGFIGGNSYTMLYDYVEFVASSNGPNEP